MFDPPVLFSDDLMSCFDVLMSCFLVLKGAHSPEDGFPRVARAPLLARFLGIFFRPPFYGQTSEIDNPYNTFSCFPKGPVSILVPKTD